MKHAPQLYDRDKFIVADGSALVRAVSGHAQPAQAGNLARRARALVDGGIFLKPTPGS